MQFGQINPRINPAERHRIEQEALGRRHQREQFMLERRHKALHRLDLRERRSLETKIRREILAAESLHVETWKARQHQIEVNNLDITVPAVGLKAEPKRSWKKNIGENSGHKQNRPRGHRYTREE
ncbi:hypothetical protein ACFSOZ_19085 [Mesorhizobium newzealandense]|uniref:Uncharacterized protein n=1 Tax=Mesorhizobium newzealandense TaxID=1300302 RepID=A0ABW4UDL3_9HYPH|nr:hypothetical protein [Mesorhizobium sophorae]